MNSQSVYNTANNAFGQVLSPSNVAGAQTFARERAAEFRQNLDEGSMSLRVLAWMGGLAMMVLAVLGILGDLIKFRWISVVFQVYTFFFGLVILILETNLLGRFIKPLYKNALFLKYVWGRGLLYIFAGTVMISLRDFLNVVVGLYVAGVGLIFVVVGRSASRKMAELRRRSVPPETLQQEFAVADVDGKGSLTLDQFRVLTSQLGMDLTKREVESAFVQCGAGDRVSYETVLQWWRDEATETDDFQGVPAQTV